MSETSALPVPKGENWEKLFVANEEVRKYIRALVGERLQEDEVFFVLRDLPGWGRVRHERVRALLQLLAEQGVLTTWIEKNSRWRYYAAADPSEAEKYQTQQVAILTKRLLGVVGSHHLDIIRRALLAVAEKKEIVL